MRCTHVSLSCMRAGKAKALQPARVHEQSFTGSAPECKIHGLVNFAGVPHGSGHVVEHPLGVIAHNVCAEQQACVSFSKLAPQKFLGLFTTKGLGSNSPITNAIAP